MAMRKHQLLFNLMLLVGGCATASAQDYYVSRLGNDLTATGKSAQSPWRTVAKMNQAMGSLRSGDKILFRAGDTFDIDPSLKGLLLDRKNGITIDSYTTTSSTAARATLRVLPGTTYGIQLQRSQGIILQNLEVIGAWNPTLPRSTAGSVTPVSYPDGIYGNWLSNSTIRNVTVRGFRGNGIHLNGSNAITVDRVTASGNGYAGVHTQGNSPTRQIPNAGYTYDILIRNSVVEDNQGDPYRTTSHSGNGILLENTSRSRIDGCLAQRNGALMGNAGDGGPVGIWAASSDGITIQHCVSRNNRSRNNQDGGGFDLDQGTTNCILQYNYSFDNQGAGFLIYTNRGFSNSGHIVRYNISDNDALSGTTGGIAVSGQNANSNKQIRIYNNTVFGRYPTSRGIILKTTDRGAKFEDYSVMVLDNLVILQDPSRAWATSSPGGFLQGNQAIPLDYQDIQAGRLSIPPIGATRPISLANPDLMPYFRIQSPSVFMTIGLSNWYLPQRGSRDFFGVPFLDRRRAVGASHGITTPSSSG